MDDDHRKMCAHPRIILITALQERENGRKMGPSGGYTTPGNCYQGKKIGCLGDRNDESGKKNISVKTMSLQRSRILCAAF